MADSSTSCGRAEGTAPYSCSRVWSLARNDPSPSASYSSAAWTARSVAVLKLVYVPQNSRLSSTHAGERLVPCPVCSEEWKQREANRLLALTGQAGPTSGMLAGNALEHGDGIHLQQFFPGACCGVLSCPLSSSPCCICLCRERTKIARRVLLVLLAQNKHSRGGRNDNGKRLDWGREPGRKRTGSRWEHSRCTYRTRWLP